jgi:hypothetical protein
MNMRRVIFAVLTIVGGISLCRFVQTRQSVSAKQEGREPMHSEPVDSASEDSFPASDPPAWTGTIGILNSGPNE